MFYSNINAENLVIFSNGAKTSKWGSIGLVQSKLGIQQDGQFGNSTEQALKKFQKDHNLEESGKIDAVTWNMLTELDCPSVEERARELTFALEGTDYDRWEWNYPYDSKDRSGATWGPAGLTVYDNEIQEVLKQIDKSSPKLMQSTFSNLYPIVKELINKKKNEAKQYLKLKVYNNLSIRKEWEKSISNLVKNEFVRKYYDDFSEKNFASKMSNFQNIYPIETELDYAFYWDLSIHTSGLNKKRRSLIDKKKLAHTSILPNEKREIIGNIFVETLNNQSQKRSRMERNLLFVNGTAIVHQTRRDCSEYGLQDRIYRYAK